MRLPSRHGSLARIVLIAHYFRCNQVFQHTPDNLCLVLFKWKYKVWKLSVKLSTVETTESPDEYVSGCSGFGSDYPLNSIVIFQESSAVRAELRTDFHHAASFFRENLKVDAF